MFSRALARAAVPCRAAFVRPTTSAFTRPTFRAFSTFYTESHEYVKVDGDIATIGISDFAQNEMGDVVYVELPNVGDAMDKGDVFGSVESVKAASSVYAPVDIEVTEINEKLNDEASLINSDAEGEGWIIKGKLGNKDQLGELLDEGAYGEHCESS